jgi:hypothetical protein
MEKVETADLGGADADVGVLPVVEHLARALQIQRFLKDRGVGRARSAGGSAYLDGGMSGEHCDVHATALA